MPLFLYTQLVLVCVCMCVHACVRVLHVRACVSTSAARALRKLTSASEAQVEGLVDALRLLLHVAAPQVYHRGRFSKSYTVRHGSHQDVMPPHMAGTLQGALGARGWYLVWCVSAPEASNPITLLVPCGGTR